MKSIRLIALILLFVPFLSCTGGKEPETILPIRLSSPGDIVLQGWDSNGISKIIQSDTLTIISGNGGYKLMPPSIWESFPGEHDNTNFGDYIEVYLEGDKIIAKRTGLIEDDFGIMATFVITDVKGEEKDFIVSSHMYIGGW